MHSRVRYFLLLLMVAFCLLQSNIGWPVGAQAAGQLVLQLATFADAECQLPKTTFAAGEVAFVRVSLADYQQVAPHGIEQLGWRVHFSDRLGKAESIQAGPVIHDGLSFAANAVAPSVAGPGLAGVAFGLYDRYPSLTNAAGQVVPTATPLLQNGVLATFQLTISAQVASGNYALAVSSTPGNLSLVTYNGKGSSPETSNCSPAADFVQPGMTQLQVTAVPVGSLPANNPSDGTSAGTSAGDSTTPVAASSGSASQVPPVATPSAGTPEPVPTDIAGSSVSAAEATQVELTIGKAGYLLAGEQRELVACYYKGADTMMPIRLLEAFGVRLLWNEQSKTATFLANGRRVELQVGSRDALINGERKRITAASGLTIAAEVRNGRVTVPLRFVSESLGFKVRWSPPKQITISR